MVRHFLTDGREIDSVEGKVIPPTGETAAFYHIVAGIVNARRSNLEGGEGECEKNDLNAMVS